MTSPLLDDDWRDVLQRLLEPDQTVLQLLNDVVSRAVTLLNAQTGAVLVPTEEETHLVFLSAHGGVAEKLLGLKVPISGSIAGYVFSTCQMMAMDLASERPDFFYQEIDKQTANATEVYLALPILSQGRCLGVSTYVNRPQGAPKTPFDQDEMEQARRFASMLGVVLNYLHRSQRLNRWAATEMQECLQTLHGTAHPLDLLSEESTLDPQVRIAELVEGLQPAEQQWAVRLLETAVQRPSASMDGGYDGQITQQSEQL